MPHGFAPDSDEPRWRMKALREAAHELESQLWGADVQDQCRRIADDAWSLAEIAPTHRDGGRDAGHGQREGGHPIDDEVLPEQDHLAVGTSAPEGALGVNPCCLAHRFAFRTSPFGAVADSG